MRGGLIFQDHVTNVARMRRLYLTAFGKRERSYFVYENDDGTFHVLAVDGAGGFIVADEIQGQLVALLIAELLNFAAALSGCQPGGNAKA